MDAKKVIKYAGLKDEERDVKIGKWCAKILKHRHDGTKYDDQEIILICKELIKKLEPLQMVSEQPLIFIDPESKKEYNRVKFEGINKYYAGVLNFLYQTMYCF